MSGHGWDRFAVNIAPVDPDAGFPVEMVSVAMTCTCGDFTAEASTDAALRDAFAEHLREVGVPQLDVFHATQRARVLPRRSPTVDPVRAAADRVLSCDAASAVLFAAFEDEFPGGMS